MAGKKETAKAKKVGSASRKAANGKNLGKTAAKQRRKKSDLTANELMLLAWEKIYANRHRFVKLD